MPNWCNTNIYFSGSEKNITDLFTRIEEYTSKNFKDNGFGSNWLGNILCGFGLTDRIDATENRLHCRGSLEYVSNLDTEDEENASFYITTLTAWDPMIKMWQAIIEKHYGDCIEMHWIAEEPGTQLYLTDDKSRYGDKYWVDFTLSESDTGTIYFGTAKAVVNFINSNFKETKLPDSTKFEENQTFKEGDGWITVIPLTEFSKNSPTS